MHNNNCKADRQSVQADESGNLINTRSSERWKKTKTREVGATTSKKWIISDNEMRLKYKKKTSELYKFVDTSTCNTDIHKY